jgi:hypothetical protein
MTAVVGKRIPLLSSLVEVLLGGGKAQKAAFSFCESVISRKKEVKRLRRGEVAAPPVAPQGGIRVGVMRNRRPRAHQRVHPI